MLAASNFFHNQHCFFQSLMSHRRLLGDLAESVPDLVAYGKALDRRSSKPEESKVKVDHIEGDAVRECLRQLRPYIGGTKEAVAVLRSPDPAITEAEARDYFYRRSVRARSFSKLSEAALNILIANWEYVVASSGSEEALHFIQTIITKYRGTTDAPPALIAHSESPDPAFAARKVFDNWSQMSTGDNGVLQHGIYQTFRRYKPSRYPAAFSQATDDRTDDDHVVICELMNLDFDRSECLLISGELHVYRGSVCVTNDSILYALVQRLDSRGRGLHQRFITSRVEFIRLPVFSGLCVKMGDTTHRPIAAEFLYTHLPRETNQDLYDQLEEIKAREWNDSSRVDEESVAADYISREPPIGTRNDPRWRKVKFLRDFPALSELAKPRDGLPSLFGEPLKTMSAETLADVSRRVSIGTFQHSKATGEQDD